MNIESDFELAFPNVVKSMLPWRNTLPPTYSTEMRGRGYGLVIRNETLPEQGDLNEILAKFLTPLLPMAKSTHDKSCILRIALFSSFATTTTILSVASLELLIQFQARLEMSVYPVNQEDEETET